ncbi:hypothetical protein HMPREF1556_00061 [Porphyromonas sp. oral taxon 278 str. W7784]|nr:hypothetical protein HMPREF1556_00061 [Porphyromonas sp. oral taxon 278 str. W7784]
MGRLADGGQKGTYSSFFDDLPWVVFGALGRGSSEGGVCTQRKGRNFFGAWSRLFLRFLAGFLFGRERGKKN